MVAMGMGDTTPVLSLRGISKSFGSHRVLEGIGFDIPSTGCVALCGENGAGKSTLMKILSGVWPKGSFTGEMVLSGKGFEPKNPLHAQQTGVAIIHQELSLFPELSVAENLFFSEGNRLTQRVNWNQLHQRAEALLEKLGFSIPVTEKVKNLSIGQKQWIEIAKALHQDVKVLLLDEPTSALGKSDTLRLMQLLKELKKTTALIYISHKLDEVFEIADQIIVLRDGHLALNQPREKVTEEQLIAAMVGRQFTASIRPKFEVKENTPPILRVENLTHINPLGKPVLQNISFSLFPGEILGVGGLMGAGRSEFLRSLFGVLPGNRSGQILYEGKPIDWKDPADAISRGITFVPEERKKDGLFLDLSLTFNLTISLPDGHRKESRDRVTSKLLSLLKAKYQTPDQPVKSLSGGNQQKVLIGRTLATHPKLLLLDEPTRGIDIAAKMEIYDLLNHLKKEGIAILMVSSELPELLRLSDRVLVMRNGRCAATLDNDTHLTQETIMGFAAERKEYAV